MPRTCCGNDVLQNSLGAIVIGAHCHHSHTQVMPHFDIRVSKAWHIQLAVFLPLREQKEAWDAEQVRNTNTLAIVFVARDARILTRRWMELDTIATIVENTTANRIPRAGQRLPKAGILNLRSLQGARVDRSSMVVMKYNKAAL